MKSMIEKLESRKYCYHYNLGDFDNNNHVDTSDFNILAIHFNLRGQPQFDGDASGDEVVNSFDFGALAGNFGREFVMATKYWVGGIDGDINNALNYLGGTQPTSTDVFTYDNTLHSVIADPASDSGSNRTWGGINFVSESSSGVDGTVFGNISLEGNLLSAINTSFSLTSINGDANITFASAKNINLLNQASGKTCTPKGKANLDFSNGGVGTIAYGSSLDSSVRLNQITSGSFLGRISVDAVTIGLTNDLSDETVSTLVMTNSGKLYGFTGSNNDVVWVGYTNAISTTGSNWSGQGVPSAVDNVRIDSRISLGGSTLAPLNQLPLTWSTTQALGVVTLADGGGKDYSWANTTFGTISLHNCGIVNVKDWQEDGSAFIDAGCTLICSSFGGAMDLTGSGKFGISVSYNGTLTNSNSSPTTNKIDLNASVLSPTAFANLSPSASAFTNYTTISTGPSSAQKQQQQQMLILSH